MSEKLGTFIIVALMGIGLYAYSIQRLEIVNCSRADLKMNFMGPRTEFEEIQIMFGHSDWVCADSKYMSRDEWSQIQFDLQRGSIKFFD